MQTKRDKNNDKHFELIPKKKTNPKVINNILKITKKRNKIIQDRKRLVKENMEVRKAIYRMSVKIADFDEDINQELISLNTGN